MSDSGKPRKRRPVAFATALPIAAAAGDRIMVLGARPTSIQATFEVPFPHPRKLSSPEVQALREAILKELGVEV